MSAYLGRLLPSAVAFVGRCVVSQRTGDDDSTMPLSVVCTTTGLVFPTNYVMSAPPAFSDILVKPFGGWHPLRPSTSRATKCSRRSCRLTWAGTSWHRGSTCSWGDSAVASARASTTRSTSSRPVCRSRCGVYCLPLLYSKTLSPHPVWDLSINSALVAYVRSIGIFGAVRCLLLSRI